MDSIGQRIKFLRERENLSMADLEKAIEASTGSVNKWEKNKSIPGGNFIIALSEYFTISTDWILKGDAQQKLIIFEKNRESTSHFMQCNELQVNKKDLTLKEIRLLQQFNNLPSYEQHLLLGFLDMLGRMKKNKKT